MQESGFRNDKYYCPFIFYDEVFVHVSDIPILQDVQDKYWISNYGRLYNADHGFCENPIIGNNNYLSVRLDRKPGTYEKPGQSSMLIKLHRLVCMAFHGVPENYRELHVNHINTDIHDCSAENVEWMTCRDNVQYSFKMGKRGVGEKSNRYIFSEATVRRICELLEQGITVPKEISMIVFGEYKQQYLSLICNIKSKKFWTSVSKDYDF